MYEYSIPPVATTHWYVRLKRAESPSGGAIHHILLNFSVASFHENFVGGGNGPCPKTHSQTGVNSTLQVKFDLATRTALHCGR